MANNRLRQGKQARNSEVYDDARAYGSGMETIPVDLEEDLNNLRAQIRRIIGPLGKWFDLPSTNLAEAVRYLAQPLIGTIDGVNLVFTTSVKFTRNSLTDEAVYWNGLRLSPGALNDYVPSESVPTMGYDTITMTVPPRAGDTLSIDFSPVV